MSGAGDVPLDLAVHGAGSVLAVDANPGQVRLLALKLAAARTLEPAQLRALFAAGRLDGARSLYAATVRAELEPGDRAYWDEHIDVFRFGLHRSNWMSAATLVLRRWIDLPAPGRLRTDILTVPDAVAQAAVYRRHYRRRIFNPVSRRLLHLGMRVVARGLSDEEAAAVRDPAFVRAIDERIAARLSRSLVREDPFWSETLAGMAAPARVQRAWLRDGPPVPARTAASCVTPVRGDVRYVLAAQPAASLDALDLSNVPDWLDAQQRAELWREAARALRPGGRLLYRSLTGTVQPPEAPLAVDVARSRELTEAESTGLYASVVLARHA